VADYTTQDGSAADGNDDVGDNDYNGIVGQVVTGAAITMGNFQDVNLTGTVINGDLHFEFNETFSLVISNPRMGFALGTTSDLVTINNDDERPHLRVNDPAAITEDATNLTFVVRQVAPGTDTLVESRGTVAFQFFTSSGTADAGADYTATSGFSQIDIGNTTVNIPVAILEDLIDEANEHFFLNLTDAHSVEFIEPVTIERPQAQGTINDDDATPNLVIDDVVTNPEGNVGSTNAVFTVSINNGVTSAFPITIQYNTTGNNPATAGADFTPVSGELVIAPGQTSAQIVVPILGDLLDEPNETYNVNLSSPVNATNSDALGLGTIVDDDATPTITIDDVTDCEDESPFVFTLTLSAPSGQLVQVRVDTGDGNSGTSYENATAPGDYTAIVNQTVQFQPGETVKQVAVTVNDDGIFEWEQFFRVLLSNPSNVSIADGTGIGTILDNDGAATIIVETTTPDSQVLGPFDRTHCIRVFFYDGCGDLEPGATADIEVNGETGSNQFTQITSDFNGEATFCFSPKFPGLDDVFISIPAPEFPHGPGGTYDSDVVRFQTLLPPSNTSGLYVSGQGAVPPVFINTNASVAVSGSFSATSLVQFIQNVKVTRNGKAAGGTTVIVPLNFGQQNKIQSKNVLRIIGYTGVLGNGAVYWGSCKVTQNFYSALFSISGSSSVGKARLTLDYRVDTLDAGTPGVPNDIYGICFRVPLGLVSDGKGGGGLEGSTTIAGGGNLTALRNPGADVKIDFGVGGPGGGSGGGGGGTPKDKKKKK